MKIYFKGDQVKLTGVELFQYGTAWAEFVYLEGHKKGQKGLIDKNHWSYTSQVK